MKRRTRARLELLVGLATLGYVTWLRRFLRRHSEAAEPLSPFGLAAGTLSAVVRLALWDRDAGSIRTSRRRGFLSSLLLLGWQRLLGRFSADSESFDYSFGAGQGVGLVCYRLWYGLLRPLPGDE